MKWLISSKWACPVCRQIRLFRADTYYVEWGIWKHLIEVHELMHEMDELFTKGGANGSSQNVAGYKVGDSQGAS